MEDIILRNIAIDIDKYILNKSSKLIRLDNETILILDKRGDPWEKNLPLWIATFQFAFPGINFRARSEDFFNKEIINSFTNTIINYYSMGDNYDIDKKNIEIGEENIRKLIKINNIVIEYNKEVKSEKENNIWKPNRWAYAYNQYLNACRSLSIEISILNLITALESLLIKGFGDITYRVCLFSGIIYTDNTKERENTFKLIKEMYNIRSKVVHGEIAEVYKKLSDPNIYDKYFKLKEICVDILIKLYKIDEDRVFNTIDNTLFRCEKFSIE